MAKSTARKEKVDSMTSASKKQNGAIYIYGIVPADVEVSPDARGVDGTDDGITLVEHGEIAALVSEIDADLTLGTPDSLMAHEEFLDATAAEVPVLPLRFGAVMTTREAVVDELLTPYHDQFHAALEELDGHAQFVVRGRYAEQPMLFAILEENPEVAQLADEIRDLPEETTRNERIQLGELINQAVAARREADTESFVETLEPLSVHVSVREPTHERDAAYVALLVDLDRQSELEKAVKDLAEQNADLMEVTLRGPMASYDFVMTARQDTERWD
ncbi:GvpL/GvpF family gas vesicle protein [Sinosporangium siamense]|uniref:Gas vesicle protein n=1 Tax=Sinosporangium siamense TaxID=1367973 RepID=A0A919V5C6_9ACTN|nr:GvpL/GvpF family gas vesicle protein [Sinosporangium siamense]GII92865.1 gas vesicle protein [Sinosporangium siamense]